MHRETAVAIWYRRLDPGCFTSPRGESDEDGRPSMETAHREMAAPEGAVLATSISDYWPTLADDEHDWPSEAATNRR